MKAKRIVYLIHSMIYSRLAARDPQVLRDTNAGIYLERERLCERRWRAAVRQLEPGALYAQLAGGSELLAYARQQLGEDRFLLPVSPVRGYLFEGLLGFPIGLFIEGFRKHDSGAAGRITIPVDCNKVTVENASGITLYADLVIDRPNRRIPVEPVRGFEGIAATGEGLEIPRGMPCCILGLRLSPDTLLEAMQNAAVTD